MPSVRPGKRAARAQEDHRKPIVGDNGVQFAVAEGMEDRFQKVLRLTGWPSEENEEDREG